MIRGIGEIILGDENFASQVLPICNSSFSLSENISTYGYSYINSEQKCLVDDPDSYESGSRIYTISIDIGTMPSDVYRQLLGGGSIEDVSSYVTATCPASQSVSLAQIAPVESISVYNRTLCRTMINTSGAVPTSRLEYRLNGTTLEFSTANTDIVTYYATGIATTFEVFRVTNNIFSFAGIAYTSQGGTIYVIANKVQITSFPQLSLGAQTIELEVLEEIKLYK